MLIDVADAHVPDHRRDARLVHDAAERHPIVEFELGFARRDRALGDVRVVHHTSEPGEMLQRADDVEFRQGIAIPARDLGNEITDRC